MAEYTLKVNGVQICVDHESVMAQEILKLAVEKNAAPGGPEDYILQGGKGMYHAGDTINLREDNLFIAIPTKSTQVA